MDFSLNINPDDLARIAEEALLVRVMEAANRAGQLIVNQIKMRFVESGDETGRWKALWADGDGPRRMAFEQRTWEGDQSTRREYDLATKHLERVRKKKQSGAGNWSRDLDRAVARLDEARLAHYTGSTSYRAGGKPLDETGHSKNSFGHSARPDGAGAVVDVTTTEPFLRYHDAGFRTKGPNFIPLTKRAKDAKADSPGSRPDALGLIPGVDYVMAWRGVSVPSRPMFHFTPANSQQIADTLGRL